MNMGILNDMARRDLSGRKNVETQRRLDLETVYERGITNKILKIGWYKDIGYVIKTNGSFPCILITVPVIMWTGIVGDILILDRYGWSRYCFVRRNLMNDSMVDSIIAGIYYREDIDYTPEKNGAGIVHGVSDLVEDARHYIDCIISGKFSFADKNGL